MFLEKYEFVGKGMLAGFYFMDLVNLSLDHVFLMIETQVKFAAFFEKLFSIVHFICLIFF